MRLLLKREEISAYFAINYIRVKYLILPFHGEVSSIYLLIMRKNHVECKTCFSSLCDELKPRYIYGKYLFPSACLSRMWAADSTIIFNNTLQHNE